MLSHFCVKHTEKYNFYVFWSFHIIQGLLSDYQQEYFFQKTKSSLVGSLLMTTLWYDALSVTNTTLWRKFGIKCSLSCLFQNWFSKWGFWITSPVVQFFINCLIHVKLPWKSKPESIIFWRIPLKITIMNIF